MGKMEQNARTLAQFIETRGSATITLTWRKGEHGERNAAIHWGVGKAAYKIAYAGGAGYNKRSAAIEDALRFVGEHTLRELAANKHYEIYEVTKC